MKRILLAIVLSCAALAQPQAQNSVQLANVVQGHKLASTMCGECHAVERGRLTSPNPEAPAFEFVANTPGMNRTALLVFLRTPHRMMPNFVLEPSDADGIIEYILSMRVK